MCDRARRSRDSSSRYSIDTLFPGLCNNNSISCNGKDETEGGDIKNMEDMVMGGLGQVSPLTGTTLSSKSSLPKVKRGTTKGGPRSGSTAKSSSVNLPRDDHDNGTNLSRPCSTTSTGDSISLRSSKVRKTKPPSSRSQGSSKPKPEKRPKNSSSVKTSGTTTKRRASSPLKPASLPKQRQITPLSCLPTTPLSRIGMQEAFQPWVLHTYGDSAKTKTITRKKYTRIIKTLRGEEINNAENSKFRFWVKAKGFHIGLPPGLSPDQLRSDEQPHLYVPTTVKDEGGIERGLYKRVAVVEQFFDIIYTVHVETEAKNGKHAGQKRTYRAITEKYAFLPREAVTKFLLQCTECQKRGSPSGDTQPQSNLNGKVEAEVEEGLSGPDSNGKFGNEESQPEAIHSPPLIPQLPPSPKETTLYPPPELSSYDINFTLPFTTTYLRRQKKQMRLQNGVPQDFLQDEDDSRLSNPSSLDEDQDHVVDPMPKKKSKSSSSDRNNTSLLESGTDLLPGGVDWLGYHPIALKKERLTPNSSTTTCSNNHSIYSNGKNDFKEQSSPLSLGSAVTHETGQDETSSNGNKEDEDDDDDESEDKIDAQAHDPERLKAFNMFVRLFVDENLDRMVPISKQPKEKIQAIIDSCTRQFPEFAERARKRIRTYLKSCRRNKRSRDSTWESSRPTPAHLTSVQAEQILAQACENESQNAKRMRMGLEPVGQPLPTSVSNGSRPTTDIAPVLNGKDEKDHGSNSTSSSTSTPEKVSTTKTTATVSNLVTTTTTMSGSVGAMSSVVRSEPLENGHVRTPLSSSGSENQISTGVKTTDRNHLLDYSNTSRVLNGNALTSMSMYRPNFCQAFTRPFPGLFPPAGATPPATGGGSLSGFGGAGGLENCLPNGGTHSNRSFSSHTNASALPTVANGNDIGPTDLSMKAKPLVSHKLNTTEMTTVRQLITGYRESAAFLLRSADELEQLIIQQQ